MKQNELRDLLIKKHADIISSQIADIQTMSQNILDIFKDFESLTTPKNYQLVLDELHKHKLNFSYLFYNDKRNEIDGIICLDNFDTYTANYNSIQSIYFDKYRNELNVVKDICDSFNMNCIIEISKMHDCFKGFFNTIDIKIKK